MTAGERDTQASSEPKSPTALELPPAQMREMVDEVMVRLTRFVATLPEQPLDGSALFDPAAPALTEPLPEGGTGLAPLLDFLIDDAARCSLNPTSAGFMGYVPGGGLFHAALADLIADTLNRYVGVAAVAPALSQIEANVLRWLAGIVGYPGTARGFLTSGGSLASLSAIITARHVRLGEDFLIGTIYLSDQTHHCLAKAARLAGLPKAALRVVPTDSTLKLDPHRVAAAIAEDRARGRTPFLLVASAGTTNAGVIDPLPALAEVARAHDLWLHVDAAYGGFFNMTARGRQALAGIAAADSIVLDPHKTLFLPYGTGALLVRDGRHLRATHSGTADYLPPMQAAEEFVDFCEISPELTRPFRGLRIWLPLKLHGAAVFRDYLDEKLDLARQVAAEIERMPELELLVAPELSILAFACRTGATLAARNERTRRLLMRLNARQRVHLTGTLLHGVAAIRVAIGVFRTHAEHVELLVSELRAVLADE